MHKLCCRVVYESLSPFHPVCSNPSTTSFLTVRVIVSFLPDRPFISRPIRPLYLLNQNIIMFHGTADP